MNPTAHGLVAKLLIAIVGQFAIFSIATPGRSQDAVTKTHLHRVVVPSSAKVSELFQYSEAALPLVSAHRGGPQPNFPENCLATFENTLRHTYAILEVDPRMTKDGAIVLHHDPTLDRTTTGKGLVINHTLAELKQLRLKDPLGHVTEHTIPTLDEALEWARGRTILVLDQKDVPAAQRLKKIEEHAATDRAMLIVYSFNDARACYAANPAVMMEVMIPNRDKVTEFDRLEIPWKNVIAFVGHVPPEDGQLYEQIHARGGRCMIGTSRNLDRRLLTHQISNLSEIEAGYREFLKRGADIIETDIPCELGHLLYETAAVPSAYKKFFSVE